MHKDNIKFQGFTLFELLAVLAIMAIIASIAVPRVMQTINNARAAALESNMRLIASSVQRYVIEKELTGCIGAPFVIHPNLAELADEWAGTEAGNDGDTYYNGEEGIDDGDAVAIYLDGNAAIDRNGDTVNEAANYHKTALAEYIENGIPPYVRVVVGDVLDRNSHTATTDPTPNAPNDNDNPDGIGDIVVIYLVDPGWGGLDGDDVGTLDTVGITATFQLGSGSNHFHDSPDPIS